MTTNDKNKIKFGLKNVTLFEATDDGKTLTYGEPIKWPGASEITMEPVGEDYNGYFDDQLYISVSNSQGKSGKLTMAYLQPEIETLITGATIDENGGILENNENQGAHVALAFEFSGDTNKVRHVLYNVSFSRPSDGSSARSDKLDAQTTELEFTAMPNPYTGDIKYKAPQGHPMYESWFTAPVKPGDTPKA